MQFTIDTPEKLLAVAPFLTAEDWQTLEGEGLICSIVHATNNQTVLGGTYTGEVKTRRVWVWGNQYSTLIVGEVVGWEGIEIDAVPVAQTIGYGMALVPQLPAQLARQNGGVMPAFVSPLMPQ